MPKILFIEDQAQKGGSIRQLLELSNYQVVFTVDSRDSIELAVTERPDLILCDTQLTSVDGYGMIEALQQHAETWGIPVILLTSMEEKGDFRKAMDAGADDFLARPFEGIDLLRAVEACLERHRIRVARDQGSLPMSVGKRNSPAHVASQEDDKEEEEEWKPDQKDIRSYKKRTMLYVEGQRAFQTWYVVSGRVKTYMVHTDGKELITGICGPGDCVGCVAVVHGGSYSDKAQVLEDAEAVVISRPEFLRLMAGVPLFVRQVIRWLSRNTRSQEAGLLNLAYSSLRKKVANGILDLFDHFRKEMDGNGYISISRENLAAIIGSAPESLTRTLSDFRREGLIEIRDGRMYLINEARLRNLIS